MFASRVSRPPTTELVFFGTSRPYQGPCCDRRSCLCSPAKLDNMSFLAAARRASKDSHSKTCDEDDSGENFVGVTGENVSPPQNITPPSTGRSRVFFRLLGGGSTSNDNSVSSTGPAAGPSSKRDSKKVRVGGAGSAQPPFRRLLLGTAALGSASASAAQADGGLSSRSGLDGLNAYEKSSTVARRGSQVLGANDFIAEDIEHIKELRDEGSSASELHHLGISASAMRRAGFTARELRSACYTRKQLSEAGFSFEAIQLAGFQPITWSFEGVRYCSKVESVDDEETVVDDQTSSTMHAEHGEWERESRSRRLSRPESSGLGAIAELEQPMGPTFEEWAHLIAESHSPEKRAYAPSSLAGGSELVKQGAADKQPTADLIANRWGTVAKVEPSASYDA